MAQHLLDEERVALGLAVKRVREMRRWRAPEPFGDHRRDLPPVQASQPQPLDGPLAVQVREHRSQRLAQLRIAVGADDEHAFCLDRAHDVRQEQGGRLVRPVEVLEHQHDRPRSRRIREQRGGALEQAEPPALRIAACRLGKVRQSPGELGNEARKFAPVYVELTPEHVRRDRRDVPTERLDERLIGDQYLLVTAAKEHRRALLVSGAGELARQTRLTDARLAGDHPEPAQPTLSIRPSGPKPAKGVLAADERAALQRLQGPGQWRPRFGWRRRDGACMRVDGLEQAAGLSRRRHVQLGPQAASEVVERHARGGDLPRDDQAPDELAMGVLPKRIEPDAATRDAHGVLQRAGRFGVRGQALQHVAEAATVRLARVVDPLLVEARQELAIAQLDGRL